MVSTARRSAPPSDRKKTARRCLQRSRSIPAMRSAVRCSTRTARRSSVPWWQPPIREAPRPASIARDDFGSAAYPVTASRYSHRPLGSPPRLSQGKATSGSESLRLVLVAEAQLTVDVRDEPPGTLLSVCRLTPDADAQCIARHIVPGSSDFVRIGRLPSGPFRLLVERPAGESFRQRIALKSGAVAFAKASDSGAKPRKRRQERGRSVSADSCLREASVLG